MSFCSNKAKRFNATIVGALNEAEPMGRGVSEATTGTADWLAGPIGTQIRANGSRTRRHVIARVFRSVSALFTLQ